MFPKVRFTIVALVVALAGCDLNSRGKTACNTQSDCLSGAQCVNHQCVGGSGDGDDDGGSSPDGPTQPAAYYGTVEPLVALSSSMTAVYEPMLGVSSASGPLGCALAKDLSASPGSAAAVAYASVRAESGDTRCPEGVHSIMNDPSACALSLGVPFMPSGCGLYRRWGATGEQVANQLAIGGYVSIQSTPSGGLIRCDGELSLNFAGGITIAKTFQFTYDPLSPEAAFCVH